MTAKSKVRKPDNSTPTRRRKRYQTKRDWKDMFIATLTDSGNVRYACTLSKVDRSTAYAARKADESFRATWDEAMENACDLLEGEAWRRALEGTDRFVIYKGQPVKIGKKKLVEKVYSDSLLMFLLKANRAKYREHVVQEHTGKDGKPIQVQDMDAVRQSRWNKAAGAIAMAGAALIPAETNATHTPTLSNAQTGLPTQTETDDA